MKEFAKNHVIYYFSPDNKPVYFIENGEEFWVDTDDCYCGQIKSEKDLRPNIDISIMDAAVGPIYINGAQPGMTLRVDILDIVLAPNGVQVTSCGLGVLGDRITKPNTRIIPIVGGYAHFTDKVRIPIEPMIGVIGVSPNAGKVHCATPGDHGGNMDTKEIGIGAKVYLPISVEGANLAVADMHARQGDGELSGTAIEIGGRMKLRAAVLPDIGIRKPVIETGDSIIIVSSSESYDTAIKNAVSDMVGFVIRKTGMPFEDAYRFVSITCDIRISQVVNPLLTVRICLPKKLTGIYEL